MIMRTSASPRGIRGCLVAAVGADVAILARGSEQLAARFRDRASG